ncbi:MAG: glutamate--tRNA ligase [Thermomicrobiaceae bacterium]|nr:glutamate--tRNA ligase [Thermomicrobiaceae bacterium]
MSERRVRVRFAPSPTGDLHVGGARTALFNWLFARQHGGDFILRIEDTDQRRLVGQSIAGIIESLRWLGLDWDEGPEVGGPYGPYFQSQRLDLYREHAERLVREGHAYYCFCPPERLEQVRRDLQARGLPPGYDRFCRNLTPDEVEARLAQGETPVIRFKMPDTGTTTLHDVLRGDITYENRLLEDLVLLKSDGFPTYHLANVVDDHYMEISHIMRAEEWIPTAPLHLRLYQAFGWEPPVYAHMPLVLNPDGKGKLSKRHGATGVLEFKAKGYVPEALVNYLAITGWSYNETQEIFSLAELVEKFRLERVSPSPARFNFDKLNWMNQYYINHILSLDEVTRRCLPYLQEAGLVSAAASDPASPEYAYVREVVALLKDRIKVLTEVVDLTRFFFTEGTEEYPADLLVPKKTDPAKVLEALDRTREILAEADFGDEAGMEARLRALADELGLKAGQLFMPIRVAVTGRTVSPGLFETLRVIGKERSLARLDAARDKLRAYVAQTSPAD